MPHRSLMASRFDRRRLLAASGGLVLAAPFASHTSVSAQDSIVATMVTDTAGIGDQNFNDLAKAGGDRAAEELGIEFSVLESQTAADYVRNLTDAAEESDLVVAVGGLLPDAVAEVAPEYPDGKFALIDGTVEEPNVLSIVFREQEGGFLAGVLAALSTQSGILGVVGGIRLPPVMRYEVGFVAGARSITPDIQILISYADDFENPTLGKELTLAQYNNGADIVLPIAGRTGVGSFDAAKEKGAGFWIIAADTDQSHLGPDNQLAAAKKGVDTGMYDACKAVVEGSFEGQVRNLGISEGGIDIFAFHDSVPKDVISTVEAYKQAISGGTIVPPADDAALEAFQLVPPSEVGASASPAASPGASPAS